MAELYNYGKFGPRLTFECNEGQITFRKIEVHGAIVGPTFANPIRDKDEVCLIDDMTVDKADPANDRLLIGEAIGNPEFKGTHPTGEDGDTTGWGDYDPRHVTVELRGAKVKMVKLIDNNTEVTIGLEVGLENDDGEYDVEAGTGNIALQTADINSGDTIAVLFGFYGEDLS